MHCLLTLAFLLANLLPPPPMQLPVVGVDIAAQVGVSS